MRELAPSTPHCLGPMSPAGESLLTSPGDLMLAGISRLLRGRSNGGITATRADTTPSVSSAKTEGAFSASSRQLSSATSRQYVRVCACARAQRWTEIV